MIRDATSADIPAIRSICLLPGYDEFIGCWSEEEHEASLLSAGERTLVWTDAAGEVQGFTILRGLDSRHRSLELMRIAVRASGQGVGRTLFEHCLRLCFEHYNAHRVELDVMEKNTRARRIYESFGFRQEGILRDARLYRGEFQSKVLMSLLEDEYRASRAGRDA